MANKKGFRRGDLGRSPVTDPLYEVRMKVAELASLLPNALPKKKPKHIGRQKAVQEGDFADSCIPAEGYHRQDGYCPHVQ